MWFAICAVRAWDQYFSAHPAPALEDMSWNIFMKHWSCRFPLVSLRSPPWPHQRGKTSFGCILEAEVQASAFLSK